jgi:hypothetical protein
MDDEKLPFMCDKQRYLKLFEGTGDLIHTDEGPIEFFQYPLNPNYGVSLCGKVWSYYRNWIPSIIVESGYLTTSIGYDKGKIHRMVCETFYPNSENKPVVNHINRNKLDNRAINLEWATYQENSVNNVTQYSCTVVIRHRCYNGIVLEDEYSSIREAATKTGVDYRRLKYACETLLFRNITEPDGTKSKWRRKFPQLTYPIPEGCVRCVDAPDYLIPSNGTFVYSLITNRYLRSHLTLAGYVYYNLSIGEPGYRRAIKRTMHRLVADAYIKDKPANYMEMDVNHINLIKTDNDVSNLEYLTRKDHVLVTIEQGHWNCRKIIRYDYMTGQILTCYDSIANAVREGYDNSCIWDICNGYRYRHQGFGFAYADDIPEGTEYITVPGRNVPLNGKTIDWKNYLVTPEGQLYSFNADNNMKLYSTGKKIYTNICRTENGRQIRRRCFIAEEVAKAFIIHKPHGYEYMHVCHKDGNIQNNNVTNLEYRSVPQFQKGHNQIVQYRTDTGLILNRYPSVKYIVDNKILTRKQCYSNLGGELANVPPVSLIYGKQFDHTGTHVPEHLRTARFIEYWKKTDKI